MADERALHDVNRVPTLLAVEDTSGEIRQLKCDKTTGALMVELTTSDIEIGGVEIKNGADDTRAVVGAGNAAGTTDNALYVADANVKSDTASMVTTLGTIDADTSIMSGWDNAASDGASVSGDVAHDSADAGEPVKIGGRARTSQITAVANNDRTDQIYNAYGEQVMAGFDWSALLNAVGERNPISDHHVQEILANASSQGNGTTYYYFDMDGYSSFGIQIENTDGAAGDNTYTIEATWMDDGTAPASCTYQDISQYGCTPVTGAAAASWTADVSLCSATHLKAVKYVRVKVVRANDGGNTDGAWRIDLKKIYA